ncbi:hypothetical protein BG004_001592 [Podila humilis]|nr:hypothetical protein BG004_001592 [Podila humilis]
MQVTLQLPEILSAIGRHLHRHDLATCVQVNSYWNATFVPQLWHTISMQYLMRVEQCLSDPRSIFFKYSHHIRSLEVTSAYLIGTYGRACTQLTHLKYEECLSADEIRYMALTEASRIHSNAPEMLRPVPNLIQLNQQLQNVELVVQVIVGNTSIVAALASLPNLRRVVLEGPGLAQDGLFWTVVQSCPQLRIAWQQESSEKSNIVRLHSLSLEGDGSVLRLAGGFPELEHLSYKDIDDKDLCDLEQLMIHGRVPLLSSLEVVDTLTRLDSIVKHAPPLKNFSATLDPQPHDPLSGLLMYNSVLQSLVHIHAPTLRRFEFLCRRNPIKDPRGWAMDLLDSCPNLVVFRCRAYVEVSRFLKIKQIQLKIEDLVILLGVNGLEEPPENEQPDILDQVVGKLEGCSVLRRLALNYNGRRLTSDTSVPGLLLKLKPLEKLKDFKNVQLFGRLFSFNGINWIGRDM